MFKVQLVKGHRFALILLCFLSIYGQVNHAFSEERYLSSEQRKMILDLISGNNKFGNRLYKHSEGRFDTGFLVYFSNKIKYDRNWFSVFSSILTSGADVPLNLQVVIDFDKYKNFNNLIAANKKSRIFSYYENSKKIKIKRTVIPEMLFIKKEDMKIFSKNEYRLISESDDCYIYRKELGFEIERTVVVVSTENSSGVKFCIRAAFFINFGVSNFSKYKEFDKTLTDNSTQGIPVYLLEALYPLPGSKYRLQPGMTIDEVGSALH